jgi:predicted N-formylglutamate amidohydrolase
MGAQRTIGVIITCEHGGNRVPAAYRSLFAGSGRVLASHRGWDPGALELARRLARGLGAPLVYGTVTRLLVDLNRSPGNPGLFSRYVEPLPESARNILLARHYRPYRTQIEDWLESALSVCSLVAHFSIHTFTPVRRGQVRRADIGLLYDPGRAAEKALCRACRQRLVQLRSELRVRMNYPYLGVSDGFTTHLRRRFGERYLGIELEVNQRWPRRRTGWDGLQNDVLTSLSLTVGEFGKTVRLAQAGEAECDISLEAHRRRGR